VTLKSLQYAPVHRICVVVIEVGNPFLQLVAPFALFDAESKQVDVSIQ